MPTQKNDLQAIADVVQEAVTNLERAAELLAEKLPSNRHAERCFTTIQFEVAQLSGALPQMRDLLRPAGPEGGMKPPVVTATTPDAGGQAIASHTPGW